MNTDIKPQNKENKYLLCIKTLYFTKSYRCIKKGQIFSKFIDMGNGYYHSLDIEDQWRGTTFTKNNFIVIKDEESLNIARLLYGIHSKT